MAGLPGIVWVNFRRINKGKGGGGEGGEGGGETDADDEFGPSTSEAAKAISLLEKGQVLRISMKFA